VTTVKIGIIPYEDMKARTLAIARGHLKPEQDEPRLFFNSLKSLVNVLSDQNKELLRIIREHQPESISDLERLTGRK